jgi:Cytidylyltransferase
MHLKVFYIFCVLIVASSAGLQLQNMLPADFFSCPRNNVTVAGLILARGGSKGIPLKNLVTIENKSLLRRSVEKMIKSKSIILLSFLYIRYTHITFVSRTHAS